MVTYAVIMAIKDGEKYVEDALSSIINQTLPPREIIVIDDGSKDRSKSIVEGFGIDVIGSTGVGQGAALNVGLSRIKSDYVSFLDCDDFWSLEKQEKQVEILEKQIDIDYVYCQVINTDLLGNSRNMGNSRVLGACTFRRSFVEKVGPFNELLRHHSVVEWWGRENAKIGKSNVCEDVNLFRLIHGNNSTILDKASATSALLNAVRTNLTKRI